MAIPAWTRNRASGTNSILWGPSIHPHKRSGQEHALVALSNRPCSLLSTVRDQNMDHSLANNGVLRVERRYGPLCPFCAQHPLQLQSLCRKSASISFRTTQLIHPVLSLSSHQLGRTRSVCATFLRTPQRSHVVYDHAVLTRIDRSGCHVCAVCRRTEFRGRLLASSSIAGPQYPPQHDQSSCKQNASNHIDEPRQCLCSAFPERSFRRSAQKAMRGHAREFDSSLPQ